MYIGAGVASVAGCLPLPDTATVVTASEHPMTIVDPTATAVGGPALPQERRLVTSIPGPRSQELMARKAGAVAKGVGTTVILRLPTA